MDKATKRPKPKANTAIPSPFMPNYSSYLELLTNASIEPDVLELIVTTAQHE